MIAALYIDPEGPYPTLPEVDPWSETRDARHYPGPWPVVAHPPCHLWTNLTRVNWQRYGGEHNRPGNDGGCFSAALAAVRKWGGVLEHPAGSWAWPHFGIPRPSGLGWTRSAPGEWVCEVWQSAYGHKARKRTWLVFVSLSLSVRLKISTGPVTQAHTNAAGSTGVSRPWAKPRHPAPPFDSRRLS